MFLVNSRLGLFSATSGKYFTSYLIISPPKATLLPKLRVHFAEFLNAGSLARLRIFISPTCVGFGTVPESLILRDYFLAPWLHALRFSVDPHRLNHSPQPADLPADLISSWLRPGLPSPGCASPHASSLRNSQGYGNMNPFPIDYAFQPRLRGRLTLGRRPLPRKPPASGGWESHPSFRYSYQHSHFRYLQHPSQNTFISIRNAPLPLHIPKYMQPVASVLCLAPLHFRRMTTRPVSCYALFQGMAASKPTSWMSLQSYHLLHLA